MRPPPRRSWFYAYRAAGGDVDHRAAHRHHAPVAADGTVRSEDEREPVEPAAAPDLAAYVRGRQPRLAHPQPLRHKRHAWVLVGKAGQPGLRLRPHGVLEPVS